MKIGEFVNVESLLGRIGVEDGIGKQVWGFWMYLVQFDYSERILQIIDYR